LENKTIINQFIENAFQLKEHLAHFLSIEQIELDKFLDNAKIELANLHPGDNLNDCADFYKDIVGDKHLADLGAWHISSKEYIADTLKLQQMFSKNLVLDFGGGIGTHAIANAMSENVEHVFFVDINKTNIDFVKYRSKNLGLEKKLSFYSSIEETTISKFDTVVCLDVLEHLNNPSKQLESFHKIMKDDSTALFNWYFYKGENNEYPFHIDNADTVSRFFKVLQKNYIEVFHPILITARSYRKFY
tara:strand:+ start:4713 stop:5450 length:738 start_codon:yes stop_codon:yes gene_type:complete